MKLKVTLHSGSARTDLAITVDATATVGDVARRLVRTDPQGIGSGASAGGAVSLRILDASAPHGGRPLAADTTIAEAGLLSGMHVEAIAVPEQDRFAPRDRGPAAARLRVLAGPDAGAEFALPEGATVIGRDRDVDVRLGDPLVSKRHARINVSDRIEIVDLGSANGVVVDGTRIGRVVLGPTDTATIGDSVLSLSRLQQGGAASAPQIDHIRSPRVVPRFPGEKVAAPAPPQLPPRQRFPYIALAAPLVMGAVMWALTGQLLGVLMMAMSPLLLVGAFIDQALVGRRTLKAGKKAFAGAMQLTRERLDELQTRERTVREEELPSLAALQQDALRLGPLLWTERAESGTFLAVRTGTGADRSRTEVELPPAQQTLPESIRELHELRDRYATIADVPVAVALRESGSVGVAGSLARDVARGLLAQLAIRHAPTEMAIAALIPPTAAPEWQWLAWLPHTSTAHSPLGGVHLADNRGALGAVLSRIEEAIDARIGDVARRGIIDESAPSDMPEPRVPALVVFVEHGVPADRARLTRIAERGPDAGVHLVWCAPRVEQLPAACRAVVHVDDQGTAATGQVRHGTLATPIVPERLDIAGAEYLARQLAPVVDIGTPDVDDSDLPRSIGLPALLGDDVLDDADAIVDRWRQSGSITARGDAAAPRRRDGTLRAVFGHAGSEPFSLDLRADGPHALVGGTTGAGKSEFLQSWVLAMAAAHSPDRLTFLFVDYKGGAAFADCVQLPHTVGLVTDLSPHLVRRALESLRAELRHREHVLNAAGAKDLASMEKSGDPACPPSLVIVVDEFAALVQEVPEFVDGVVDVAQRGRSLGLHLVLATQRPAGVIKDNLRANTNLRIALRMADAEDSADILGDQMAAFFDPSVPGRGAVKIGPGRLIPFQTGYAGGHTSGEPPTPRIDVAGLGFGVHADWEEPQAEQVAVESGPNDISRIVRTAGEAATRAGIPAPRRPWLDELAAVYRFDRLPNPRVDTALPLGVIDEPARQAQPAFFFEPDDGNLVIFGAGGAGKSTALRTIAVAAAATARHGGPAHVYGLDFGSRGLSMLDGLPHVGAIIQGDDEERVVRLLRLLRDIVDERAVRYAAVNAGSVSEYRALAQAPEEPRILLLVDGIGAFKEQYEFGAAHLSASFSAFAQIAADGRALGVHVVATADRPNALPTSIASTMQQRIVLRLAHEDDYLMLGAPRDVLSPVSPPGRGIVRGLEVQIAVLGASGNIAEQAREMERLGRSLGRATGPRPAGVGRVPEHVLLADLPVGPAETPVIGVDDVTLGAAVVRTSGPLLLAGPPGSGRTTAVATLGAAVRRADPALQTVLLSSRRSVLASAGWSRRAEGPEAVLALASELVPRIEARERFALFVEGLPEFTGTEAEYELDRLVKAAAREELFVVGEGESSTWSQAYTLGQPFKASRRGLILVPGEMDGDLLLGTPLGRIRRADFPAGRGFLIAGGRAAKVQVAHV
ncbi:FtsK/SpoIIIE domain-containing protein [Microbacterium sp. ASV81]|uniref:FtsK/SpoIIIE domain-containing protein n=1 Tax=Microbacterium capsulatum TaxID=3041921 RepID=A0ABU0XFG9_9MICO|nr:FtsK/SpoIIIE domain-containing protein [Microbacterium sp. ASV81]MDQ4213454.1 FtsK/SpoIIIE domain-containing protein [Microbacterium sp. ASV81]